MRNNKTPMLLHRLIFLSILSFTGSFSVLSQSAQSIIDSLTPEGQYIQEHIYEFATPEYYAWKMKLRTFQRVSYAAILSEVCKQDGFSAIIAYVKMQLQSEYSLNHSPIYFLTPRRELIPLPQDWSFRIDPWKKE